MERWVLPLLALVIAMGAGTEVGISVDISHSLALPRENVTLTCRLSGARHGTVLRWYKTVAAAAGRSAIVTEVIAVNDELTALYASLHRYDVITVPIGDVMLGILNIYMVTVADSGRIFCDASSDDIEAQSVLLQVFDQPRLVHFQGYKDGDVVVVTEGDNVTGELVCHVVHVLPRPHITFHVGHRGMAHHFTTNITMNVFCRQHLDTTLHPSQGTRSDVTHLVTSDAIDVTPPGVKACPVHFNYDVLATISFSSLRVTYRDDGSELTCSSNLTHSGWTPMSTRLTLDVRYAPKFNCSRSLSARVHETDFVISCTLISNPPPSQVLARWRYDRHSSETRLSAGHKSVEYRLEQKVLDTKHSEVRLQISVLQDSHFVTYHFDATNPIGSVSHPVKLSKIREIKPTVLPIKGRMTGTADAIYLRPCTTTILTLMVLFLVIT